jgi:hypothetical protein
MWIQQEAIELCRQVEPILASLGCHVALTGGLLYKDGPRKDCDLIIYRAGGEFGEQRGSFAETIDRDALLRALEAIHLHVKKEFVRVVKCIYGPIGGDRFEYVDLIFPELDGEYQPPEGEQA